MSEEIVYPVIKRVSQKGAQDDRALDKEVWLRIQGFLSLKSKNTQRTYTAVIKEWCEFLSNEVGSPEESPLSTAKLFIQATDLHAIAYRNWLEQRPGQKPRLQSSRSGEKALSIESRKYTKKDGLQSTLSNATIAKKFSALRRIYRMLLAYDLGISYNPFDTDRIPSPSAKSGQKRPTEMIDFEKVKEIISLPDISSHKGLRDRALLSMLFGGALRRSEVVNIRIGDIRKTPTGTLYVHLRATKARTDADQAIPDWASGNIEALLQQRTRDGAEPGDYLFISFRGQAGNTPTTYPISDSGLYKLFKRYCSLAGAGSIPSPHSARATAITKLLDSGVPHREVQEFSRHASVQMVEVYDKRRIGIDQNPAKNLSYD